MNDTEKRRHKRLPLRLDLSCHRVDCPSEVLHAGRTVNVSTSGIYFETSSKVFEAGHMLKVELSIPPTDGLLEFGGRISGFAKVLRTHCLSVPLPSDVFGFGISRCRRRILPPAQAQHVKVHLNPARPPRKPQPQARSYTRNYLPPTSSIQGRRPADVQCTLRPHRLPSTSATQHAHAPVPQAIVIPLPRSHVRIENSAGPLTSTK